MKPQLLKVAVNQTNSFSARHDTVPYMNNRWHYHSEVELIYFRQGNGTQFIGDSIKRFQSGDVVLVGAYLPHYWRFDDIYFEENSNITADVQVIHFCENFWGDQFLNLPENKLIKTTLDKAKRGIQINNKTKAGVGELINQILNTEGPKRIMLLIEALMNIGNSNQQTLSSIGFRHDFEQAENDRIHAIYDYSLTHFKRKIQLEEIANIANISPNSFCRYFKSRTTKTYSQFLNEIRVGSACKLLIENKINIKQICFESGFHNFASFHKHFKLITGKSPLSYQKEFLLKV
ncbi:AraC family transcriptional regulator [Solitalea lacus]|uniref:AraC family transcriptional regulator n=1 Tax=Solitalea lacus TaxID=2911172 RepID=UPI001EDBBFED|nr:AraC family transcriptional regulator [Solitalea lacus]UKJ05865.1 AraC family transcriptional regulator [Solitalea lacus]